MSALTYDLELVRRLDAAIPLLEESIEATKAGISGFREVAVKTGAQVMIQATGVLEEKGPETIKGDEDYLNRLKTIRAQYREIGLALGNEQ